MEDYENNNETLLEEDELDLVALVSSNANDTSQYLVFVGSDKQYYAKNVSKIEELLVYKDIEIIRNNDDALIVGTADIRGNMTTIINFDKWFGNHVLEDKDYELIILANYGGHKLGIIVKSVEYIVNIPSDSMTDNSKNNEKTSFLARVPIGQKQELCTIFDSDKMLIDTFDTVDTKALEDTKTLVNIHNDNLVLFADDSRFIRTMVESLFKKMSLKYRIYTNGQELLDDLKNIETSSIGLFITDLEMPVLGGKEVISNIREDTQYDNINIIVHTNMSNNNMGAALIEAGAQDIIGKVNMLALNEAIEKFMI